ncbi:hypothetical protein NLI96_g5311 [Meripilus lineatus]|uniref:RRM domain-containing protein n=1 Tax=Meripilus lineatus TaxID=2056292 RepID=A0AAD5YH23_9APHY|nr:hypothetical protein NLI96_g5311 [Physisporinus lineatus]
MASLLERMSIPATTSSVGPVRSKGNNRGGSSPYNRSHRPPKGDINGTWEHDLYRGPNDKKSSSPDGVNDKSLSARLGEANGEKGLSIKGASSRGNVVQVGGLAKGTTAEDVEAIFKRCGPITEAKLMKSPGDTVQVRVIYKHEKDAQAAVAKFHGQPADGRTLEVKVVGGVNASLGGRLGIAVQDLGSVDVLMDDSPSSKNSSKLRSDEIIAQDSRATVMVAPPGANPLEYTQQPQRGGGRGRGRGRGRGGRRGPAAKMEVD